MISVIISVFNKKDTLSRCLDSVLDNDYADREVIAVDDVSTDGSLEILREYAKKGIILVELATHQGISCACNAGLEKAKGDIIVRTDADTVVPKDWLSRFVRYFRNPQVVAVGGSYYCLNDDSIVAYSTSAVDAIFSNFLKRRFLLTSLRGANRAVRKSALMQIKKFDESFADSEDIKIFLELKKIGKVIYDPGITVATHYPSTLAGLWKRHYGWGYAVGRNEPYLKSLKTFVRPAFIVGFYIALFSGARAMLICYLFFLFAVLLLGLKVARKKKIAPLLPFIFLFQNTAYCCGMAKGLCKWKTS